MIADDDGTRFSRADVVPVVRSGRVIAVLTRHTEESKRTGASRLERNYRSSASALLDMIGEGSFPHAEASSRSRRGEPRVGDGLILLNREGRIRYASPNGVSVLYRRVGGRHRGPCTSPTSSRTSSISTGPSTNRCRWC